MPPLSTLSDPPLSSTLTGLPPSSIETLALVILVSIAPAAVSMVRLLPPSLTSSGVPPSSTLTDGLVITALTESWLESKSLISRSIA